MSKKLVSFDLWANMAVLKKPDVNKDMYLTYNVLHKPMLLGILGAIVGLDGYKENGKLPAYYNVFKNMKVGIQPLQPDNKQFKANYQKTAITYNNSVGYASQEEGGNLIVTEQTLIDPYFRCYLLIDLSLDSKENKNAYSRLYENLKNGESHYIPYIGKNEFQASWIDYEGKILFQEYDFLGEQVPEKDFFIESLFSDEERVSPIMDDPDDDEFSAFFYFENLPFTIHEQLFQYDYRHFKYTNAKMRVGEGKTKINHLYPIAKDKYVYLY